MNIMRYSLSKCNTHPTIDGTCLQAREELVGVLVLIQADGLPIVVLESSPEVLWLKELRLAQSKVTKQNLQNSTPGISVQAEG